VRRILSLRNEPTFEGELEQELLFTSDDESRKLQAIYADTLMLAIQPDRKAWLEETTAIFPTSFQNALLKS
jgi:hypothetical protein